MSIPQTSTHSHTDAEATMQSANLHVGSSWGFSVVLKDTSTLGQEEPGSNPPIVERLIYHCTTVPLSPLQAAPVQYSTDCTVTDNRRRAKWLLNQMLVNNAIDIRLDSWQNGDICWVTRQTSAAATAAKWEWLASVYAISRHSATVNRLVTADYLTISNYSLVFSKMGLIRMTSYPRRGFLVNSETFFSQCYDPIRGTQCEDIITHVWAV